MENYRIYFGNNEKDEILKILGRSNDVVIDNIDEHSVGITIERDDAEFLYMNLLEIIEREVYSLRQHNRI
jgi:hypothetical protein